MNRLATPLLCLCLIGGCQGQMANVLQAAGLDKDTANMVSGLAFALGKPHLQAAIAKLGLPEDVTSVLMDVIDGKPVDDVLFAKAMEKVPPSLRGIIEGVRGGKSVDQILGDQKQAVAAFKDFAPQVTTQWQDFSAQEKKVEDAIGRAIIGFNKRDVDEFANALSYPYMQEEEVFATREDLVQKTKEFWAQNPPEATNMGDISDFAHMPADAFYRATDFSGVQVNDMLREYVKKASGGKEAYVTLAMVEQGGTIGRELFISVREGGEYKIVANVTGPKEPVGGETPPADQPPVDEAPPE